MSQESDRIAVPTNGRGPHPVPEPAAALESGPGVPSEEEISTAFSPKQLAIGFAILASLVVLLVGRARRGRSGD
jgi:hypothetical protein